MSQQLISNNEPSLNVRNSLNQNFTELYGSLSVPIKLTAFSGATNVPIPANTFITNISITPIGGTPTLNIGTTNGGGEILPTTTITDFMLLVIQTLFQTDGILYFNTTGVGSFNIRIDYTPNYN